tara:strand:+ start:247 stop:1227 length:981 start_codon:yes stop_codon:yes gene_type:complete
MKYREKFKAFLVESREKKGVKVVDLDTLDEGNVLINVSYSSFNYKDGLAITGKIPIIKKFPMIPGVDFCGTVIESQDKKFKSGDKVILNGWGVGEKHTGGFAQIARVNSKWLINLPAKISDKESMIIGSAGYTAALCVMEIQKKINLNDGEILVTGASGGVGSIAVNLLYRLGFEVVALSNKDERYLKKLGAKRVLKRKDYVINKKPLNSQKWAASIDTVGGDILSNIISEIKYDGMIASTGLAKSPDLSTTVYPFILRNITLSGIDCVYASIEKREKAWQLIEETLDFKILDIIKNEKGLQDLVNLSQKIIKGEVKGRTLINVNL